MGSFFQRKRARYFLAAFKWCRVTFLLAVLLVVASLAYLQLIGLPEFLKKPLLETLRQRGFDAQFASARFHWGPAIVIENAFFSATNQTAGPRLSARWTELALNADAFLHARLQVDSFQVRHASLRLPVSGGDEEPLSLTNVNLRVMLLSNDVARLTNFSAWSRGIGIQVDGEIHDFLAMRDWKLPLPSRAAAPAAGPSAPASPASRPGAWDILQKIQFGGTPELRLHFSADGRDRNTLQAKLEFTATHAQTPWGESGPLRLEGACERLLNSGNAPFFKAQFWASDVRTPWAASRWLTASVDISRSEQTNFSALVRLSGHQLNKAWQSPSGRNWVRVADLRWDGAVTFRSPLFKPETFAGTLSASQTESALGSVGAASLVLQSRRLDTPSPADPAWGLWNQARPFSLDWQAQATNILTPKLKLDRVTFQGGWHPPLLTVSNLAAVMYRGLLNASGVLDVASREAQTRAAVDFDPHQIAPVLTGPAQHWISLYDWETPPSVSAGLRFVLPPWTNRIDVWPAESRNSVQLAGHFSVGRGAFRGVAVSSARSHFSYTNQVWSVSGLRVAGPGGSLGLDYAWNELTGDYHFRFDSKLDPSAALSLLTEPEQRTLRQMSFSDAPEVQGDVWGNWRTPAATGFAATLAAGHFAVRGETADQLSAQVDFTNRFLRIRDLSLVCGAGRVEAPLAGVQFGSNGLSISMTNASSTLDPEPVRRALGKYAPPFMAEIHFDSPPSVKASGSFTPGHDEGTDMRFFVQGGQFHWKRFTADAAQGAVDYRFRTVIVTNVQARVYKTGKLQGSVTFEWKHPGGTRFSSELDATDINLSAAAQQLTTRSNHLEGMLDGHVALAAPFGASYTNVFGGGWFRLRDGLLWDIKIFGVFSQILNTIAPGAGNSRARDASVSFVATNGVFYTDDLEIHSSGFRLLFRGSVDSDERLNARVEAKLLRDTPGIHYLSWMLTPLDKIFEYRVTGTLQNPKTAPLYIPKIFMDLLRPFHTLKGLMPAPPAKTEAAPAPTPAKQTK